MPWRSFLISLTQCVGNTVPIFPIPASSQSLKSDLPKSFSCLNFSIRSNERRVELVCHTVTCTHSYLGRGEQINRPGSGLTAWQAFFKRMGVWVDTWPATQRTRSQLVFFTPKKGIALPKPQRKVESGFLIIRFIATKWCNVIHDKTRELDLNWSQLKLTGLIQVWVFQICPAMISGASIWG